MGVEVPVGFGQCVFRFATVSGTDESLVTLGFEPPDELAEVAAFEINKAWTDPGRPFIAASICSSWRYLGTRVTLVTESGPLLAEEPMSLIGTGAETALPPNVAILVNKITALGGRRNRGRMFFPPFYPPESIIDSGGLIQTGVVAAMQSALTSARGAMVTAGYPPFLFHSAAPFTPAAIVALQLQGRVATQRRRLRR